VFIRILSGSVCRSLIVVCNVGLERGPIIVHEAERTPWTRSNLNTS